MEVPSMGSSERRTMRRGWVMAVLVALGVAWIALQGISLGFVVRVGGLAILSGYWTGRIVNWRAYQRDVFGVVEPPAGPRLSNLWFNWLALGAATVVYSVIFRGWRYAVAAFVLWWAGVLIVTLVDVRGQLRIERYIESLDYVERERAIAALTERATSAKLSIRHVYTALLIAAKGAIAERLR